MGSLFHFLALLLLFSPALAAASALKAPGFEITTADKKVIRVRGVGPWAMIQVCPKPAACKDAPEYEVPLKRFISDLKQFLHLISEEELLSNKFSSGKEGSAPYALAAAEGYRHLAPHAWVFTGKSRRAIAFLRTYRGDPIQNAVNSELAKIIEKQIADQGERSAPSSGDPRFFDMTLDNLVDRVFAEQLTASIPFQAVEDVKGFGSPLSSFLFRYAPEAGECHNSEKKFSPQARAVVNEILSRHFDMPSDTGFSSWPDCSSLPGSKRVKHGKRWDLEFRVRLSESGRYFEVWRDAASGALWTDPLEGRFSQQEAIGGLWAQKAPCDGLQARVPLLPGSYRFELPTWDDFELARKNGAEDTLAGWDAHFYWTSTVFDPEPLLGFPFFPAVNAKGVAAGRHRGSVRCVMK